MFDSMTALVIDDAATVRKYVTKLLTEKFGFANVIQEASAADAMGRLKTTKKVDLIICDWEMPRISGFVFLKQLKQDKQWKDIPFIMATSRKDKDSIVMAIESGVSEYLIKPFNGDTLETKLSTIFNPVAKRRSERHAVTQKTDVQINFKGCAYSGEFMDVSEGGCQIKTHAFKNGGAIFDNVMLSFQHFEQKLTLKAKLIRMEGEHDGRSVKAGFVFDNLEYHAKLGLKEFIDTFRIALPEDDNW